MPQLTAPNKHTLASQTSLDVFALALQAELRIANGEVYPYHHMDCIIVDGSPAEYATVYALPHFDEAVLFWAISCLENSWSFAIREYPVYTLRVK